VSPLEADIEHLSKRATSSEVTGAARRIDELVGDRQMVLRVDRMEPAKNLLRGFWAFDELLDTHPEFRGKVVLVALAYLSRQTVPEYLAYTAEVEHVTELVNDRWRTDSWTPIVLDVADDPGRSFAALTRYDVLLVNPLRDGLNLVAKEGPMVNARDGVLALSREAGSFAELSEGALEINPFDVTGTAEVLAEALSMPAEERAGRAKLLRDVVSRRAPSDWLDDQLAAARA
jgi:trehalose 6-phosphate synthase